jgi:hypothetical protein
MLYRVHLAWAGFELTAVIATECIGRYKSNYHTITATMAPKMFNNNQILESLSTVHSIVTIYYANYFYKEATI